MESKRKIFMINIISVITLAMCLIISVMLMVLVKSKTEIFGVSANELKNNYATTEDTTNTWDVSANEDGSVMATLADDGTLTISGTGAMMDWNTSSSVSWSSVRNKIKTVIIENGITNIGNNAFSSCTGLTSIEISSGITSIGKHAFSNCTSITNIEIPSSVTSIGDYAFMYCESLTNIKISSRVTSIGHETFRYCTNLTNIEIDENNPNYMDDEGVLYTKNEIEVIKYPDGKTATEYEILSGTISIGDYAFYNCSNLTDLKIPSSIISIGYDAIHDCTSLINIEVDENNTKYMDSEGVLYTKDEIEIIKYPGGKSLTEYTILSGTISIGNYAFYNCNRLINIDIPSTVTSIGSSAFYRCSGLINIEIPNSVTSIGNNVFNYCTSLKNLEIPNSVTSIGYNSFSGSKITKLIDTSNSSEFELPNILKRTQDENDILYSSSGFELTNCTIENNNIKIEDKNSVAKAEIVSGKLSGLTYLVYNNTWDVSKNEDKSVIGTLSEDGTLTISGTGNMKDWNYDEKADWYKMVDNIKNIIIENGVTNIGDYAFYESHMLTSIKIANSVTRIGDSAFEYSETLTNIEIPSSVTSIGDCAFLYCENLISIEIPNSVTSIGNDTFAECYSLMNIEVSESNPNYMDDSGVLYTKDGTQIIKYPEGKNEAQYSILNGVVGISDWTFYNTKLININIPNTVTYIGEGAFCYSIGLANIEIPNSVKIIGKGAFYDCESLASIEIPNGVLSIGNYAFEGCINLTKILIPNSVIDIGDWVFYDCNNLTIICKDNTKAKTYAQENGINYLIIMDGINPKTTVSEIGQNLENATNYEITDKNGAVITETENVGTGCRVTIADGENYIIIVTGDCNGDGEADKKDILAINKHRLNKASLEMEYLLASDVNEDGETDKKDILQINKFRLGKIEEL